MAQEEEPTEPGRRKRSLSESLRHQRTAPEEKPTRLAEPGTPAPEPHTPTGDHGLAKTKPVSAGAAIPLPLSARVAVKRPKGARQSESIPRLSTRSAAASTSATLVDQERPAPAASDRLRAPRKDDARLLKKLARDQQRFARDAARHSETVRRISARLGLDPNRPVTEIPPLPGPAYKEVEFITVEEGRAFIRISFNTDTNRYLYEVIEPALTANETELLELIRDTLVRTLESRGRREEDDAATYITHAMDHAIVDHSIILDEVSRQRLRYYLLRDFLGYGPIDVFMRDPMLEDISCDGPGIPVYLFHRAYESIKTTVNFEDEIALDSFVIRLAQRCGKQISIAEPLLDATLPDKSRLQCSLSREVTTRGSTFTIRKFRTDPLTPTDLCRLGTLSPQLAAFLWLAMEEGISMIFAGGTASGKTSTLNAASAFIPPQKKVVSIEDTREINLPHENWIAGLTRAGFGGEIVGGKVQGTIDMYKLLESALRQRPEYLIVGEVRGPEAQTLFQAMATGHATYSTLHADSVPSAVYRLENAPISVPRIMLQTLGAVAIQVQARVAHRLVRRLREVVEIVGVDPETKDLLTNTVFEWDSATDEHHYLGKSVILERIMTKRNWSIERAEVEWTNRTKILNWMLAKGIRRLPDVVRAVSSYYSQPKETMDKVNAELQAAQAEPPTDGA